MIVSLLRFGLLLALAALLCAAGGDAPPDDPFGPSGPDDPFAAESSAGSAQLDWSAATLTEGRRLFAELCSGCHGPRGDANIPAADAIFPRPRDLTAAVFRFRSTATGRLPLREDLLRTLARGLPGTAMPSWSEQLDLAERMSLVLYVETLSPAFAKGPPAPEDVLVDEALLSPPPPTPELLERGRKLYDEQKCGDCHGADGSGDGPSAPTLKDNDGRPSDVFDFTWGVYKGGYDPIDVYRTFVTGLNGTPMPSYAPSVPDERDRWALVHYCRSLSRDRGLAFYLTERPTWQDQAVLRPAGAEASPEFP